MKAHARTIVYLAAALMLLAVAVIVPGAWAEPLQSRLGQTVPTATVPGQPSPTPAPPTQRPANTPVPPTIAAPEATAAATETAAPPAAGGTGVPPEAATEAVSLALVKEVSREHVWPGATVFFTLTLTNTGNASVRQVRLEDALAEGLEPGAIQGTEAAWAGRTLRVQRAVLPPGGRLTVVFAARVADNVPAGGVIVNQAVATAGAGLRVTASAQLMLPPLELPPTGARLSRGRTAR